MPETDLQDTKIAEVVSVVAHKLKNPLSVIRAYIEVLLAQDLGKINAKQKEYLSDVLENVKAMTGMINSFLSVARIDEGNYAITQKPVDLLKLTREVINNFSYWTQASNSEIKIKFPKKLPLVLTDRFKIKEVLENLISNAFRYKGSGRGKILITLEKKGKEVLFSCTDNGIGIQKDESEKIFSKFYRSEKALKIDPLGSGLGLYISKAIVELSGGKIWFESNKKGTTFYFTLPIAKDEK